HRRIRLRAAIEGLFLGATVGWHGYRTGTAAHDSQGADRRINLGHDWGITTGRASFGRRSDEVSNEYWCVVRRPTEVSLMWPKVLMLRCAASQGPVPGRVGVCLQQGHRSGVGPRAWPVFAGGLSTWLRACSGFDTPRGCPQVLFDGWSGDEGQGVASTG